MATNTKKKSDLKNHLKEILSKIKIEDSKENVRTLEGALGVLIEKMKQTSPTFNTIYNRIYYTGSYYEGLRIKNATEFDLNLVLRFPLKNTDLEVTTDKSLVSFARCHFKTDCEELQKRPNWPDIQQFLKCCFDSEKYLSPEKVKRWLIGIVDRVLQSGISVNGISKISRAQNGPATTLYFTTNSGVQLDVDLVPVLEFVWPCWPNGARKDFINNIPDQERFWFLVPKPAPEECCSKKHKVDQLWRLHFPGIERHLLYNKGCVKPIIKLLKLLRDAQGWSALASYYLKTVVMLAVIKDKSNSIDWSEGNMDAIFLKMLNNLHGHLEKSMLPYLFYHQYNLLYKLKASQSENVKNHLQRIIKSIETDPKSVYKYMQVSVAK